MYYQVIVDIKISAVDRLYTYQYDGQLERGTQVIVPFGHRLITGYIFETLSILEDTTADTIRSIIYVGKRVITPYIFQLIDCIRTYSYAPYAKIIQTVLPRSFRLNFEAFILAEGLQISYQSASSTQKQDAIDSKTIVFEFQEDIKKEVKVLKPSQSIDVTLLKEEQREIYDALQKKIYSTKKDLVKTTGYSSSRIETMIRKKYIYEDTMDYFRYTLRSKDFVKQQQSKKLTKEQERVYNEISHTFSEKEHPKLHLLHGITGSGKTEIYLSLIQSAIAQKKQVLLLIPEILLSTEIYDYVSLYVERSVLIHSKLTKKERYESFEYIQNHEVDLIVGVRSALFAPYANLGLIIVDEAHDASYIQDRMPYYDTIQLCEYLSNQKINVLLGTGTPKLEMYVKGHRSYYEMSTLFERPFDTKVPTLHTIDMKHDFQLGNTNLLSMKVQEELAQCFEKKEKAILLLNKRGVSSQSICPSCGAQKKCTQCDFHMTLHASSQTGYYYVCHHCYETCEFSKKCTTCGSNEIVVPYTGTQGLEREVRNRFKHIEIFRLDADTTQTKGSAQRILEAFKNSETGVLIGTQMIAKGLNIKGVTHVTILSADAPLEFQDFEAVSRLRFLIIQVAGRAGRYGEASNVYVQTFNPEHYVFQNLDETSGATFYRYELAHRKLLGLPPFKTLFTITVGSDDKYKCYEYIQEIGQMLQEKLNVKNIEGMLYGHEAFQPFRKKKIYYQDVILHIHQKDIEAFNFQKFISFIQKKYSDAYINITHKL